MERANAVRERIEALAGATLITEPRFVIDWHFRSGTETDSTEIEELATDVREAPMAGGLLFEAQAVVVAPPTASAEALRAALEEIADELMVEIRLSED